MESVVDAVGRVVVPKALRDALGLTPGTVVDISAYGSGVQITPGGRTARLERDRDGRLVSRGTTPVTDDEVFALLDAGRR
ncbi:MAG: AbrB/MazE/SpoVT family DNA-binding domain-containing protein [Propionibacteriaceae bacterium]|nr:AbrB/MazE/SpoVT family DNA-binding domain-containing protein [Propionibacteriaceae bacterium]